ncbi:MAG: ATP-binding cassette domain-containing protein, partial [Cryobacterium sp.]
MTTQAPVVDMTNISISFPGVKALDRVNFRMFPGEVHSLMGENGAGKSTMIKALTGVYPIDSGSILLDGKPLVITGPAQAQEAGISTVYQEVHLLTN